MALFNIILSNDSLHPQYRHFPLFAQESMLKEEDDRKLIEGLIHRVAAQVNHLPGKFMLVLVLVHVLVHVLVRARVLVLALMSVCVFVCTA